RSWVASVTTDVLARTAAGIAAKAAEPAARPMATTRAFNRRLLGITELLSGRGDARQRLRTRSRATQNPPCILPTRRRVCRQALLETLQATHRTVRARTARMAPSHQRAGAT